MTVLASMERKPKRIGLIPTSGALGAQVTGVDLSQPLDDETFAEIEQAFYDNLVLVFRDHNTTLRCHRMKHVHRKRADQNRMERRPHRG